MTIRCISILITRGWTAYTASAAHFVKLESIPTRFSELWKLLCTVDFVILKGLFSQNNLTVRFNWNLILTRDSNLDDLRSTLSKTFHRRQKNTRLYSRRITYIVLTHYEQDQMQSFNFALFAPSLVKWPVSYTQYQFHSSGIFASEHRSAEV